MKKLLYSECIFLMFPREITSTPSSIQPESSRWPRRPRTASRVSAKPVGSGIEQKQNHCNTQNVSKFHSVRTFLFFVLEIKYDEIHSKPNYIIMSFGKQNIPNKTLLQPVWIKHRTRAWHKTSGSGEFELEIVIDLYRMWFIDVSLFIVMCILLIFTFI